MRFCPSCRKWVAGRPVYCSNCGRTWNYRICPRGHLNPPDANYCSTCGSLDLSSCSGMEPWFSRLAGFVSKTLPKVILIGFAVFILLNLSQRSFENLVGFVIVVGILVIGYSLLPRGIKRVLGWVWGMGRKRINSRGQNAH